jgi:hypothetical protein
MNKTTHHTETFILAHDELMRAVLDYLGPRTPQEYDELTLTAERELAIDGSPLVHTLTGVTSVRVIFTRTRES